MKYFLSFLTTIAFIALSIAVLWAFLAVPWLGFIVFVSFMIGLFGYLSMQRFLMGE